MTQKIDPKKRRNKKLITGSRWTIFFVFAGTCLLSFLFWLTPRLTSFRQQLTSPLVISSNNKTDDHLDLGPAKNPAVMIDQFKKLTQDLAGSFSFVVWNLKDDSIYGLKQDKVMPAASLVKLPVMVAYFRQVEAGKLSPLVGYTLASNDKVNGAGLLVNQPAGTIWTNDKLVNLMGKYSDNTAYNIIKQRVGPIAINQIIKDLKMEQTNLEEYETSPLDIARLFKAVFDEGIINQDNRKKFFDSLTDTAFEERIPSGIPENIKVAHKVGTEVRTFSDAGIIFADPPFILVIMSNNAAQDKTEKLMADFAAMVYEFETN